jgi:hypothetical protein
MVPPHHILLNKGEKTSVGGVVDRIKNGTTIIPLKLPPPTLTLTNHVPIVIHMGVMYVIVSHSIQSNSKTNHKPQINVG